MASIDLENLTVTSWNSNPPRSFSLTSIKKWKEIKTEPKKTILGMNSY
jgi:hypothetical protein